MIHMEEIALQKEATESPEEEKTADTSDASVRSV